MSATIQVRRGTASQWSSANPTLAAGEIGFESDNFKIKIGNGSTAWNSLSYAAGGNQFDTSIVFEGATADSFETTLQATDPTADRTITLPDATGTVALTTDLTSYAPLSGATFTGAVSGTSLTLSGDLTVNGTTTTINSTAINVNNQVVFEGTTANDFETTLTVVDPTADRTITFPDSTGTVALLDISQTLTNKTIDGASNTISNINLASQVTGTLPVANGGTGITSLGTGVATFLGTPSSSNLAAAVTDETGSGALVFGTSPTLATPIATTALTLNGTAELRLADTDSSHYVGFKSPGTVSTNRIWTLPATDGTSGQALQTNGSGTLSWASVSSDANPQVFMLMGA
jgi:hypothetical protein